MIKAKYLYGSSIFYFLFLFGFNTTKLELQCPKECLCKDVTKCVYDDNLESIFCLKNWNINSLILDINVQKKKTITEIFSNCSNSNITALMIMNTGSIKIFSNKFFNQLLKLQTLVINGPGIIEELSIDLFSYNKNLNKFRITKNKIKILDEMTFSSCAALQQLFLPNNIIESIIGKPFQECANLLIIDLEYNQLNVINKDTFYGAINLKRLILAHNSISYIEPLSFSNLENLQIIDLSFNLLLNIDVGAFYQIKRLLKLLLNGNKISAVSIRAFNKVDNLKILNLKQNKIEHLDESIIGEMKNLEKLQLDSDVGCIIKRDGIYMSTKIREYLNKYKSCNKEEKILVVTTILSSLTTKQIESRYSPLKNFDNNGKDKNQVMNKSCVHCNITLSCQAEQVWISFLAGIMTAAFIILLVIFLIYIIFTQRIIYKLNKEKTNQDAMSLMTTNTRSSNMYQSQRSEYKPINDNHDGDIGV